MVRRVRRLVAVLALAALALPARAAAVDPSADGRFPVGVTTLTFRDAARGRTLVTEVWYPAQAAGRDTAARRGTYPLVLVAHGHCGFRTNYEYLSMPLASWGFLVAAPDFPGINQADCDAGVPEPLSDLFTEPPRDLEFLRGAFHDRSGPARAVAPLVRGRRAGLVGHSLGGYAVVHASLADPNLTAVVALAPLAGSVDGQAFEGLRPGRAVLVAGGTADTTLPFDTFAAAFFTPLPAPAFLLEIVGGTHSGFTDMDSHLPAEQLARQQALTRRYATAFLRRYLADDRRFAQFLAPADAAREGPDVVLTARLRR
jgi:predicted dienelactone hydrolase